MLKELESRLKAEGFEVHRIAASEAAPMDQLVVALDTDKQGRERSLWLTPLPDLERLRPGQLPTGQKVALAIFPDEGRRMSME